MDGADAIVEWKGVEIGVGRSPLIAEIVDFHGSKEGNAVAVEGFEPADFGEVGGHIVERHVTRRGDGDRRVGREAVVGESHCYGFAYELFHLCPSIAELRVGMEIVVAVIAY